MASLPDVNVPFHVSSCGADLSRRYPCSGENTLSLGSSDEKVSVAALSVGQWLRTMWRHDSFPYPSDCCGAD